MIYITALFVLGMAVAVHEFGHFIAGRYSGIPIRVFSIGFGPRVAGFDWGGTDVRLSLIPLGGYVLPAVESEDDYFALEPKARIVFSLGGPAANVLFAIPLIALINALSGASSAYGLLAAPFAQAGAMLWAIIGALLSLFSTPDQVSSIVGIATVGGQFTASGLIGTLQFAAIISLNLAVFNLIPLPPLDGGKIALDLIHAASPRLGPMVYVSSCVVGWILLFGLMIYATIHDVARLMA